MKSKEKFGLTRSDIGVNITQHGLLARVAELADAPDLKSVGVTSVPVRVRPRAPYLPIKHKCGDLISRSITPRSGAVGSLSGS